jgi:hypothetical protein
LTAAASYAVDTFPPEVTLLAPLGGEGIENTEYSIRWQATDDTGLPSRPVRISYSTDNGSSYTVITSDTENDGECWWWMRSISDTSQARIKVEVRDLAGNVGTAESSNFSIVSVPYVEWTNSIPSVLMGGATQEIAWRAQDAGDDLAPNSVTLKYKVGSSGSWVNIAADQTTEGTCLWTVPSIDSSGVYLRAEARDTLGHAGGGYDCWLSIRTNPLIITVNAPNGGQNLTAGQNYRISWSVSNGIGLQQYPYSIYYSIDNGATYALIVNGLNRNTYFYDWQVPIVSSNIAKIKVTAADVAGQVFFDESDNVFSIQVPPLGTVRYPNGGEVLRGGSTYEVRWYSTGEGINPSDYTVNLKYSVAGGAWENISLGESNDGSYVWSVPALNSSQVKVRVEIVNTGGQVVASDESNSYFTIDSTPPAIVINRPQEGYVWENQNGWLRIAYQATDNVGIPAWGISLYYSGDGGISYQLLTSLSFSGTVVNDDNYRWISNAVDISNAKIKIEARDQAGWVTSIESGAFRVVTVPLVSITSPSWENNIWRGGSTQTIRWNASDAGNNLAVNPITIKYSVNGGTTWEVIASGEANDGEYSWLVPTIDSANAKIRVEAVDVDGNVGFDTENLYIDSTPPAVTLTAPNGGENLYSGQSYYIRWTATDAVGLSNVSLYYSTDGGATYLPIALGTSCWSPYLWAVPQLNSSSVKIKIEAADLAGYVATDESDAVFSITVPPFGTVLSPNGGEEYYSGWPITIRWHASGEGIAPADYLINLSYQVDDGGWQTVATGETNDGSCPWTPSSSINSLKVKVKVETVRDGQATATDESDAYFSVRSYGANPGIIVKSPSSGEVWTAGSTYRISWEAAPGYNLNDSDRYHIYLTYIYDNAFFYVPITSEALVPAKTCTWRVPSGINTSAATIEVYTLYSGYLTGRSGLFSISAPASSQPGSPSLESNGMFEDEVTGARVIFPEGATAQPVSTVNFSNIDLPESPPAGAVSRGGAIGISSSISNLLKSVEISLSIPEGVSNPRAYIYDEGTGKWSYKDLKSIGWADGKVSFKSDKLGTFAVFDIVDSSGPSITEIKINGRFINNLDSIISKPNLTVNVIDNYGVDASAIYLSVDGSAPKTFSISSLKASAVVEAVTGSYLFSETEKLPAGSRSFKITAADEVGNMSTWETTLHVLGDSVPNLVLYPNPCKADDSVTFEASEDITVRLYDISGALVWSGQSASGTWKVTWNTVNSTGSSVASGVYLYVVTSNSGGKQSGKLAIIR